MSLPRVSTPVPAAGSDPSPAPTLADVVAVLDGAYPPASAQSWDAVGLVCGDPDAAVRTVLFAVDPVTAVIDEAIEAEADLLVVHHPLLLRAVHSVAATTPKGRAVHRLVTAGCGLYVAHTNADTARPGVSDALARVVGLDDLRPLVPTGGPDRLSLVTFVPPESAEVVLDAASAAGAARVGAYARCGFTVQGTGTFEPDPGSSPVVGEPGRRERSAESRLELELATSRRDDVLAAVHAAHPYSEPVVHLTQLVATGPGTGIGRVGTLGAPTTLERFALAVSEALPHTPQGVRVSGDPDAQVRTVAVCGGNGDDLFDAVRASGADVYLTADLRHHLASEARETAGDGTPYLIDVAHWASEWPWLHGCADRLHRGLAPGGTTVETRVSVLRTDPWTLRLPSSGGVVR